MQWLRTYLPMQGTWVWSCSGKIPHAVKQLCPCATAAEPVLQSPQATTTESAWYNYCGLCSATKSSPCSLQLEKAHTKQQRSNTAQNKINIFFFTRTNSSMLQNGDKKWQASQAWWYLIVQEKKLSSTLKLQKLQISTFTKVQLFRNGYNLI